LNAESLSRLDEYLESSAKQLFDSNGIQIEAVAEGEIDTPFASTIGFTSPRLRGALVLSLSRELVAASLPANLRAGDPNLGILADWTGELSNQLLGRLKNRLCAAGIDIALSTPIVFFGKEMRNVSHRPPLYRALRFKSGSGRGSAEFQAEFAADLELVEAGLQNESATPEGEALFF